TPLHALSRAASPARPVRVARSLSLARILHRGTVGSKMASSALRPVAVRHRYRLQTRGIDDDMPDALPLPRVCDVHETVRALDHRRVGVFPGLALEHG